MASSKTEATELSVGFGILDIDDLKGLDSQISYLFSNTLPIINYQRYIHEFTTNENHYRSFVQIGKEIRNSLSMTIQQIQWTGGQKIASTIQGAKDLFIPAINLPVSIKDDSNVVANPSPQNLFINLPSGMAPATKTEDWFIQQNRTGLQNLYECVKGWSNENLPQTIEEFYATRVREDRKRLQKVIQKQTSPEEKGKFQQLYKNMCDTVSFSSAEVFNTNYFRLSPNMKNAVHENIFKQFFRINSIPYLLVGYDHGNPFIVKIPDLTSLKVDWLIQSIEAKPLLEKGQSEVLIRLGAQNKKSRQISFLNFHVEIRWSHGKFCGNPEGKLYKNFHWTEIPFVNKLYNCQTI